MGKFENKKTPEERIADLEKKVKELSEHTGGMLSSADFRKYVIREDVPKMKELFRQRKWDEIDEKTFIIDPFNALNLMPFSYDLSIGNEAFSFRLESRGSFLLGDSREKAYYMEPGETVIVRTWEYIALPHCYSATVWPRFNLVREGIFQSMVKIDPTWYGQLGVALTNMSPAKYPIWRGKEFATLILYKLTKDTDIMLYRTGEVLDANKRPEVTLKEIKTEELKRKIKEKELEGKCTVEDQKLTIEVALSKKEFESLIGFYDSEDWKKCAEEAMRMKTMNALGLPDLDLLLDKDPDGERLTRENVAKEACTQQALINAAIERGKPFDLIANIPKLVRENIERELIPKIHAEVEASLFPKTVTLTLTVLGFLSLIIAVAAFMMGKYRPEAPAFVKIDWPITVTVLVLVIAAVLIWALYQLMFHRSPDSRTVRQLKKKVAKLEKTNQGRN